ncbi:MAG: fatty acid desaturase [Myxococcales bacterium]|nr:fatty acid desaturase [Myxococcales bacterium]
MTKRALDEAWRAHAGHVAWPTIALAAFVVAGHVGSWWVSLHALAPTWAVVGAATLLAYLAFTVMHEAAHGNVHGSRAPWRLLNELSGWTSGALLVAPFPAFRVLHLLHHSHTNHPAKDPDYWVAGRGLGVALRCFTILPHYYGGFLFGTPSKTQAASRARVKVITTMVFFAALAAGLSLAGFGRQVLFVWMLPAWLASGLLAFLFDWLPHHPHDVQERFRDTRAIAVPGLGLPTLGQNLHLVHHLYPRVPFYRYHRVFAELRTELEAKGAPIVAPGTKPMEAPRA